MSVPTPAQLKAYLDDIVQVVEQGGTNGIPLLEEYRWLEPNAHIRPKRGTAERSSGGGEHDVSDEVAATAAVRGRIEWAARNVVDARNRLLSAVAALNDAVKLLDPPPTIDRHERSLPHPADRGDLARARDAKERREKRARLSGDWDEVTG